MLGKRTIGEIRLDGEAVASGLHVGKTREQKTSRSHVGTTFRCLPDALRSRAISSALRKANVSGISRTLAVDFPAPLGPAKITACRRIGLTFGRESLQAAKIWPKPAWNGDAAVLVLVVLQ